MTNLAVQLEMVHLAESIRRLPEGPVEQQVRAAFLRAVERLEDEGILRMREWDVWAHPRETFLWAVTHDDRTVAAVLRHIDRCGTEARILINGEVHEARIFSGPDGSAAARAFAAAKRGDLAPGAWLPEEGKPEAEASVRWLRETGVTEATS